MQVLLILLKRQYVSHIIKVIDDLLIKQMSNLNVILCIHHAGHKSEKWVSRIDHILTEVDSLYKTLNTFDMLSVHDLPRFVTVYDENVQVGFLRFEIKLASLTYGDSFLRIFLSDTENVLFILFMEGYTTSVIPSQNFICT